MPIRINSFMGKFGWFARKHFPMLASDAYLKLQFATRSKSQKAYCDYFLNSKEIPMPNVENLIIFQKHIPMPVFVWRAMAFEG